MVENEKNIKASYNMFCALIKIPKACLRIVGKTIRYVLHHGLFATLLRIRQKINERGQYEYLGNAFTITQKTRKNQENHVFSQNITISIIVPLFNTPEMFLREMINSVQAQTYRNWELCMADGSDEHHGYVGRICREYASEDNRIKYRVLEENQGISGNTNACLAMSTGQYIGLFDHDDLLHPSALFEVMRVICEKDADYIFTDEIVFSESVDNIISAHFKPDFGPDTLLANNYICHFSVFSRMVYENAGSFRSKYDGSQDHDFILRATDCAKNIVHIPKFLYFWRSHPNSVASDISAKGYAITSGITAVADFLNSKGIEASVESSPVFPAIYRITYRLTQKPLVSIVITNQNRYDRISRCVNSVLLKTAYVNYEIVIVDSRSSEESVHKYYDNLKKEYGEKVRIIYSEGPYSYAKSNNLGVENARGDYVILLDRSMVVRTGDWIEELLMYAQRKDVGVVGPKIYGKNNAVEHAWVVLGMGPMKVAGHVFCGVPMKAVGYNGRLWYAQECSAVTSECIMVKKNVWYSIGGLDTSYSSQLCGVDFCLKARDKGLLVVWNPYANLQCRKPEWFELPSGAIKWNKIRHEAVEFGRKWEKILENGDPYYNPNLTLVFDQFQIDLSKEQRVLLEDDRQKVI